MVLYVFQSKEVVYLIRVTISSLTVNHSAAHITVALE